MSEFFQRAVLHNLGLRLIAIALAVGLWLAVARDPVAEVALDIPVEIRNIPQDLEISSEIVPKAQIRLRGPERIIHQLHSSDVYAAIEFNGVRSGERSFDLTAQQIHEPAGLEVVQIVPSQFHLTFDVRLTRAVPIQPRVTGNFAQGYRIGQVVTDPSTVTITGPKGRVEAVESATTDPVDISGAMNRVTFVRHAYVSDPLVEVTRATAVRITVIMEQAAGSGAR
ncbi:MAG TPA: CdaR family protein [Terriglobales bacterium]|nr:CdaR family protein [Terriglobales bacterium]